MEYFSLEICLKSLLTDIVPKAFVYSTPSSVSLVAQMVKDSPSVWMTWAITGLGRLPGGGHGNPLQCSCLENPMDRGLQPMGSLRVRHD